MEKEPEIKKVDIISTTTNHRDIDDIEFQRLYYDVHNNAAQ